MRQLSTLKGFTVLTVGRLFDDIGLGKEHLFFQPREGEENGGTPDFILKGN
jgi:hypothetical protein